MGRGSLVAFTVAVAALGAAEGAHAQQITEYPLPEDSAPGQITAAPDGALWFTQAGRLGRITLDGRLRDVALPGARPNPAGIAAGRDAIFYTDRLGSRLGRVELDGTARDVDVQVCPAAVCGLRWPDDIAVAPDGSPWFSVDVLFASGARQEDAYHEVCSLSATLSAGQCTRIDDVFVPTGHNSGGPTLGPDGAMWLTNKNERIIGRIPSSGPRSVQKFRLTRERDPEEIAAGPDGALWFTEPGRSAVGRITTGGAVSEFRLARSGSSPAGIAAGPDGNVWFTEAGDAGNAVARITPSGVITEFPLPNAQSGPRDIVTGPDGALWFTEGRGDRIGRLSLPAPAAPKAGPPSPTPGAAPGSPPPASGPAPGSSPGGGTPTGASAPTPPGVVTGVRPRRLVVPLRRSRSLAVRLDLARPATVGVRLQRAARGRRRVAGLTRRLPAGRRTLRVRLPRRGLRLGAHQLVVELSEGGRLASRSTFPVRAVARR